MYECECPFCNKKFDVALPTEKKKLTHANKKGSNGKDKKAKNAAIGYLIIFAVAYLIYYALTH